MTDTLPPPLTPIGCDLRDFAFMPLDVARLRDSDLAATPDGEVFRAAVISWCTAWHQLPAASLPDDDAALARLLGYGRDVRGWTRLRQAGALRGFIKCSDGRLYHPVVAEKAISAWEAKKAQRDRTEKARQARLSQKQPSPVTDRKNSVTDDVTETKGEGQGEGDSSSLRSDSPSASESPAFIALTTNRPGHDFIVTQAQVDEFRPLYPAVDVEQQLRSMRGWLIGNPGKRKTAGGMLRFITTWLSKEQDKGPRNGTSSSIGSRKSPGGSFGATVSERVAARAHGGDRVFGSDREGDGGDATGGISGEDRAAAIDLKPSDFP